MEKLMKPGRHILGRQTRRTEAGLTLVEVMVAFLVSGLALAGMVSGYVFANTSAEKFGLSLAANAQASQWMEQMRSATWDISSYPVIDQLTSSNFSSETVTLESASNGTNLYYMV